MFIIQNYNFADNGYYINVCGKWSLSIPLSNFKLKWNSMPSYPDHKFSDRY